jgi:hypothetical protein
MANIKHSGGVVEAIVELGFDAVKYFELTATGVAQTLSMSPPARKLVLKNTSLSDVVYFNVSGSSATTSVSSTPGDNIKLHPSCSFEMDFDALSNISLITGGASVTVEGILGWKGTRS